MMKLNAGQISIAKGDVRVTASGWEAILIGVGLTAMFLMIGYAYLKSA